MLLFPLMFIVSSFRHENAADKSFGVVDSGSGSRTLGLGIQQFRDGVLCTATFCAMWNCMDHSPIKRLPEVSGHASPAPSASAKNSNPEPSTLTLKHHVGR